MPNLITEVENFSLNALLEGADSEKTLFVEGICMQSEITNRNGRKYPKSIMETAVESYVTDYVAKGQALGELSHPPRTHVELAEASHLIEKLWWEGNNVHARAKVLNTPKGLIVRALIEGGWIPTVSTRGTGSVKAINGINEVQSDFRLTAGFDFVTDQSAPDAIMAGVFESVGGQFVLIGEDKQEQAIELLNADKSLAEAIQWELVFEKLRNLQA